VDRRRAAASVAPARLLLPWPAGRIGATGGEDASCAAKYLRGRDLRHLVGASHRRMVEVDLPAAAVDT
jgi:hypothetical protein